MTEIEIDAARARALCHEWANRASPPRDTTVETHIVTAPPATPIDLPPSPAGITRLSDVEPESISWLWPGRLARGKFTLIAGDPGRGKSRLTFDIACRVTRGATWPDGGRAPKGNVLFLLAEDGLADTVRPAIDQMGGDADCVYVLDDPLNLARELAKLDDALCQVRPELVVIDPITAFLGKTDSYKDAEVRGLLAPLIALIDSHRAALLAVAHLAKDAQRAALYRPGGSIAFVASARLVFALGEDPNDAARRILMPLKANICAPAVPVAFTLPDGCVEWQTGVVDIDVEALLGPSMPQKDREHRADAEHFLREALAAGETYCGDLYQAAAANGISEDTLKRAKARLHVHGRLVGFGRDGRWFWSLPTTERAGASSLPSSAPSALSDAPESASALSALSLKSLRKEREGAESALKPVESEKKGPDDF